MCKFSPLAIGAVFMHRCNKSLEYVYIHDEVAIAILVHLSLALHAVYSSYHGLVEVLPVLSLSNGEEVPLSGFKLTLKHPISNVMELCLNMSTYIAVLPILLSLMVHCESDSSKKHLQVNFRAIAILLVY